jgi:hypothetical protein
MLEYTLHDSHTHTSPSAHVRALPFAVQRGHHLLGVHQLVQLGGAHGALLSPEEDVGALLFVAEALSSNAHR